MDSNAIDVGQVKGLEKVSEGQGQNKEVAYY